MGHSSHPTIGVAAAVLAVTAMACQASSPTASNVGGTGPNAPDPLPLQVQPAQVLAAGSTSAASAALHKVLTSQTDLDSFWVYLSTGGIVPQAGFADSLLLAVTLGPRPTSGFAIHVDSLTRLGDTVQVHLTQSERIINCPLLQVITSPYQIVQVPRLTGPFSFAITSTSTSCS